MYTKCPGRVTGPLSHFRTRWQTFDMQQPRNFQHVNRRCSVRPPEEKQVRADLVARVRKEIAEGTYETSEKLEKALERLFENLQE